MSHGINAQRRFEDFWSNRPFSGWGKSHRSGNNKFVKKKTHRIERKNAKKDIIGI